MLVKVSLRELEAAVEYLRDVAGSGVSDVTVNCGSPSELCVSGFDGLNREVRVKLFDAKTGFTPVVYKIETLPVKMTK